MAEMIKDFVVAGPASGIKNMLASYIHLHFLPCPELAATFVENALRAKLTRLSKAAD
jgi:cobyrinic acid a,c-diamide synthase